MLMQWPVPIVKPGIDRHQIERFGRTVRSGEAQRVTPPFFPPLLDHVGLSDIAGNVEQNAQWQIRRKRVQGFMQVVDESLVQPFKNLILTFRIVSGQAGFNRLEPSCGNRFVCLSLRSFCTQLHRAIDDRGDTIVRIVCGYTCSRCQGEHRHALSRKSLRVVLPACIVPGLDFRAFEFVCPIAPGDDEGGKTRRIYGHAYPEPRRASRLILRPEQQHSQYPDRREHDEHRSPENPRRRLIRNRLLRREGREIQCHCLTAPAVRKRRNQTATARAQVIVLGDFATLIECARGRGRDMVVAVPRTGHRIVEPSKRTPREKACRRASRYVASAGMAVSDANDARHMYPRNKVTSPLQFDSKRLMLVTGALAPGRQASSPRSPA